jgi:hypothetical protein
MQWSRYFGIVDLGVAAVVIAAVALPPREMIAIAAERGDETAQLELALAEARTQLAPADGMAVSELSRRLGEAGFKDWAIDTAVLGAKRAKGAPDEWRALLAASTALVDRLDVQPALEYAGFALQACHAQETACPSWEEIRMKLYEDHLDAGIKSGIDPHKDPAGFRRAGESGLRSISLKHTDRTQDGTQGSATPASGSGSGSGSSSAAGSGSGSGAP